jgi:hypothetical protein
MAGWKGLEPSPPRRVNQLTACELWTQRVDCSLTTTMNEGHSLLSESSRIDRVRGDILETVTGR